MTKLTRSDDLWLVMNIGCLECGEESSVVGVYRSFAKATEVSGMHNNKGCSQHEYQVFQLPEFDLST